MYFDNKNVHDYPFPRPSPPPKPPPHPPPRKIIKVAYYFWGEGWVLGDGRENG